MSNLNSTQKVILAIVVIAIISYFIPYNAWDYRAPSSRYVVEGEVASIDNGEIAVAIETSEQSGSRLEMLGAYVVLSGKVPSYCSVGQSVQICIPAESSLYKKIGKSVELCLYKENNLLFGLIVPMVTNMFFEASPTSMTLVDIDDNGTTLGYYKTKDRR